MKRKAIAAGERAMGEPLPVPASWLVAIKKIETAERAMGEPLPVPALVRTLAYALESLDQFARALDERDGGRPYGAGLDALAALAVAALDGDVDRWRAERSAAAKVLDDCERHVY